ncbi:hypothetical protein BD310DRAFT_371251 [Dichomitus squalens]|uniref:Uncharacterized protein n=1 Tax=Dichomitus squalens TaxID=114155 RepID=A0A4Q9PYW0_9APHY|nr:hypothetical protein BD310DRAFT_371251 [Dichomitus squalens]
MESGLYLIRQGPGANVAGTGFHDCQCPGLHPPLLSTSLFPSTRRHLDVPDERHVNAQGPSTGRPQHPWPCLVGRQHWSPPSSATGPISAQHMVHAPQGVPPSFRARLKSKSNILSDVHNSIASDRASPLSPVATGDAPGDDDGSGEHVPLTDLRGLRDLRDGLTVSRQVSLHSGPCVRVGRTERTRWLRVQRSAWRSLRSRRTSKTSD